MTSTESTATFKNLIATILLLQFAVYATVLFDIAIARQIIGFIYFMFVPGFVICKLLKLDKLDAIESLFFSVGLSITFLMVIGLLLSAFSPFLGFTQPLSIMPSLISTSLLTLICVLLLFARKENVTLPKNIKIRLSPIAILVLAVPVLSVIAAMWISFYWNNLLAMITVTVLASLFFVGALSKKILPSKLYPLAIFIFAISILYQSSLISTYLVPFGSDISLERFVALTVQESGSWSPSGFVPVEIYNRLYAMLSVTVLPTMYSVLLNIDLTWVFKILYPFVFSLVPVVLYKVWQNNIGKTTAFIASFLLIAQATFYTEMLGLARQMIAELFFVLLLFTLFSKKISPFNKKILFMVFSFSIIVSHYALAEIFVLFLAFAWAYQTISKRPTRNISIFMIIFFVTTMFSWYVYTSQSAVFESFVSFGENVFSQLGAFFNLGSRGSTVLRGLGLEAAPSLLNQVSRVFAYLVQGLIVCGFIGLLTKRLPFKFEPEQFTFILAAIATLVALIAVPGLAGTLNMTRFYHILLFFLAPLCALGAIFLTKLVFKDRFKKGGILLATIIIIPYFLFQTGFIYEVAGVQSWSFPLSGYRMSPAFRYSEVGYVYPQDVSGAIWMSNKADIIDSVTYADSPSRYGVLTSHGQVYRWQIGSISNNTIFSVPSYIFLSRVNFEYNVIIGGDTFNTTSLRDIFDNANIVYTNGGCQIYRLETPP